MIAQGHGSEQEVICCVQGAPSLRAQEQEDGPRPVLKHSKLGCSKCRYSGKGCGTCRAKAGAAGPLSASPKRCAAPLLSRTCLQRSDCSYNPAVHLDRDGSY